VNSYANEYLTMIEDCERREDRLTDWERGFIDSLRHRLEANNFLTFKQTALLDDIWERVTKKG